MFPTLTNLSISQPTSHSYIQEISCFLPYSFSSVESDVQEFSQITKLLKQNQILLEARRWWTMTLLFTEAIFAHK